MTATDTDLLASARRALAVGLCVLPVANDKKLPGTGKGAWKTFQERRPTESEIEQFFTDPRVVGLGYICGTVSGGLVMLEVEARAVHLLPDISARLAMLPAWQRIDDGYRERSPSGGLHWLYRVGDTPAAGNEKLASSPEGVLIETRGEGGWTVAAPTSGAAHASGAGWQLEAGSVEAIATITADEQRAIWDVLRSYDQTAKTPPTVDRPTGIPAGDRPGDLWAAQTSWDDIMRSGGWEIDHIAGDETYWRRPGVEDHHGATTNYQGSDLLYVFTSSTGFEPDQSYTKLAAYAVMHHGGDIPAAASALAAAGWRSRDYGTGLGLDPPAASREATEEREIDSPRRRRSLRDHLVDVNALDTLPRPTWLVDGVLQRNSLAVVYGTPGCGKTFVVLDWALSVATGTWWFCRKVEQGPVLYIVAEGAEGMNSRRLAWQTNRGIHTVNGVTFLTLPANLLDRDDVTELAEIAGELNASMVVVDTLARSIVGADENSARDIGMVIDSLEHLRHATGACVVLVHHDTKAGGTPRGSSVLLGNVDTVIAVTRDHDLVTLRNRAPLGKQKNGREFADIRAELVETADSLALHSYRGSTVSNGEDGDRPVDLMEKISLANEGAVDISQAEAVALVKGRQTDKIRALAWLVREGHVKVTNGTRGAKLHTFERPFRASMVLD